MTVALLQWSSTEPTISLRPVFVDEHLNGFHILAYNAVVDMGVQISL